MAESARISSVQPLRDMKAALTEFSQQVGGAFSMVDAEIGRMTQWLQQERPAYYKHAVRGAEDAVVRAKSDISRKQYMILGPGQYRFGDFLRIGLPLTVLIALVSAWMSRWLWLDGALWPGVGG